MSIPAVRYRSAAGSAEGDHQPRAHEVIEAGRFILGPEVAAFEREFAGYLGVGHVVGVANGTDAITIALRALGVRPGRRGRGSRASPSTPAPRRWSAPARARCSATSIPATGNVTPETVRAALTPGTSAIITVDLFGSPAPTAGDPGARPAGARGRRAGRRGEPERRSAPERSATPPRSRSIPPRTSAASGTAARSPPMTTRWPSWHARCDSTVPGTRSRSTTSATTRAWTSCRRRSCASSCLISTPGRTAGVPRRACTRQAGLGEFVGLPVVLGGGRAGLASVRGQAPARRCAACGAELGGDPGAAYYRTPLHRQPAMAPYVAPEPQASGHRRAGPAPTWRCPSVRCWVRARFVRWRPRWPRSPPRERLDRPHQLAARAGDAPGDRGPPAPAGTRSR